MRSSRLTSPGVQAKEMLRPMYLGEILDRAFHICRSRFLLCLVVATMPVTARMAVTVAGLLAKVVLGQSTLPVTLQHRLVAGIDWFASRIAASLFSVGIWFVFVFLIAQVVTGDQLSVRLAISNCLARWRSWLFLSALLWLIGWEFPHQLRTSRLLLNSWLSLPFWLSSILTTLEVFVLIAPLCLSIPAWALEKRTALSAIARSWTLSKRAYGRMFIAWLLKDLIAFSLTFLVGGLVYFALRQLSGTELTVFSPSRTLFWITLPGYVSSILIGPLFPIALTLIYYDQRIRLEGYDIEWMMDAAGMNSAASHVVHATVAEPITLEESQG